MTADTGNFEEWNRIWKAGDDDGSESGMLFTKEKPKDLRQFWQKCYFTDLQGLIKDKNYTKFLEQGAGRGTTSMYLTSAGAEEVHMLDLAPEGFKLAKTFFTRNNLKLPEFIMADVRDTGLKDNTYDCIYNIGLLEHFEDPEPVLREAYRLLRPGGMIFMVVVPEVVFKNSLYQRILLNPVSVLKHIIKKIIGRKTVADSDIIRTGFDRSRYAGIMKKLGAGGVRCMPYNPYPKIYVNDGMEKNILLPVYRLWYSVKKKFTKAPYLETSPAFAFCDLLVCYKN